MIMKWNEEWVGGGVVLSLSKGNLYGTFINWNTMFLFMASSSFSSRQNYFYLVLILTCEGGRALYQTAIELWLKLVYQGVPSIYLLSEHRERFKL